MLMRIWTRKKLVATANRREGVYKRAGEPSVTFCGKEERRREWADDFSKEKSSRTIQSPRRLGRGDKTWTCGLCVPNAALYQTEPHLEIYLLLILLLIAKQMQHTNQRAVLLYRFLSSLSRYFWKYLTWFYKTVLYSYFIITNLFD